MPPTETGTQGASGGDAELRPNPAPALLVGIAVALGALAIAALLRASETRSLDLATELVLTAVSAEVEHRMAGQFDAVERFAMQWDRRGERPQAEFAAAAEELVGDFASIRAIGWIDPEMRLRWQSDDPGAEADSGRDLGADPQRRAVLEAARAEWQVAPGDSGAPGAGGVGFTIYVPLQVGDGFDGWACVLYRFEDGLEELVRNLAPGFEVTLRHGEREIYARPLAQDGPFRPRLGTARLRDFEWTIAVSPGPGVVATHLTRLPGLVAFSGSLLGLGLAWALYLAALRRRRARRLSEEVERRSAVEKELSMLVQGLPDHIWSARVTRDGFEALYFSPTIERITGRPADTFREHPETWIDTVHEADRARVRRVQGELLRGSVEEFGIEYRIQHASGEMRWVRERVHTTLLEEGVRRIDGVTSDITDMKHAEAERLRLETTIQQAQKLESLGVLAGGIAHDFNNLLVGVLGHARLALEDLPGDSPVRAYIERVERAAKRAAELCRQMLAYAGMGAIESEPLDLGALIGELGELLAASTSKKVTAVYEFEDDLPRIEGDASQIRQVVLNLITNASEAIGAREGSIRISGRRVQCTRADLDGLDLGAPLVPGTYVALGVADDGCGMDAETLERFFEPFFSTKFSGRGLGLAAVQGIVRGHRGAIQVSSEVGEGTEITLYFPALPEATEQAEDLRLPEAPWEASGTILLVDDEEDARELGAIFLERAGFHVLTAVDGVEGLSVLRRHREQIVCVLLDLTMPRLDGAEALAGIRRISSDLPVVLCSGYPEIESVARFSGLGLAGFLQKPYTPEVLLAKVRAALGA